LIQLEALVAKMNHDIARKQHAAWLRGQVEVTQSSLNEAEAMVAHLRAELAYFDGALKQITGKLSDQALETVTQGESKLSFVDISRSETKRNVVTDQRSPKEMLRTEFLNQTLADVIWQVLNSYKKPVNADGVAQVIFDTRDNAAYGRARNSLSTELRRGVKEGRWKQVGRGLFVAKEFPTTDLSDEFKEEYHQAESVARKKITEHSKVQHSASLTNGNAPKLATLSES
jgi:hypothetical protein